MLQMQLNCCIMSQKEPSLLGHRRQFMIYNSSIEDFLKDKEFEKRVKELTTDAMERFFRTMYNKRNFWKSELKNG